MTVLLILMLIGALAGVLAGLLGVGGGLIIVPALVWLLPHTGVAESHALHVAVATSLASICVTSLASARSHFKRGAFDRHALVWLTPGLLLGSGCGALLVAVLSAPVLTWFVASFCLFVAWRMHAARQDQAPPAKPLAPALLLAGGSVIGAVSAAVGIGGGSLTVPFLTRFGTPLRTAIATSAAGGFPIALAGTVGYCLADTHAGLSAWSVGLIDFKVALALGSLSVLTAPLGAALTHRWPVERIRSLFAGFLLIVAVLLVLG